MRMKPEEIEIAVILLERIGERVDNVKILKRHFPSLKIFKAIDWKQDWRLIKKFLLKNKIPVIKLHWNTRGKYARWVSVLMACKYVIDNESEIILLEDDVLLPSGFDFQFSKWYGKGDFVKLSKWGEAYYMNKKGASKLIKNMYTIGIYHHNDMFIGSHVRECRNIVVEDRHLVCGTNKGNIKLSRSSRFSNKNLESLNNPKAIHGFFQDTVSQELYRNFVS